MRRSIPILIALLAVMLAGCKQAPSVPDGPRTNVERGPAPFSVAEISGLVAFAPDSVSWNQYIPTNANTGPLLYLMKPGTDMSMSEPHIRMDYVSKTAPNSATVNEIFTWLINWYNSEGRTSQVVNDKEEITTADGEEVRILEIMKAEHINTTIGEGSKVSAKRVAYAYLDNGNGYWIGASLTVSGDLSDYDSMMESFRQLVASFRAGGQH